MRVRKVSGKEQPGAIGVWEKVRDSGVWWNRYRVDGRLKRENVGRKGYAIALDQLRKSQTRAGSLRKFVSIGLELRSLGESNRRSSFIGWKRSGLFNQMRIENPGVALGGQCASSPSTVLTD